MRDTLLDVRAGAMTINPGAWCDFAFTVPEDSTLPFTFSCEIAYEITRANARTDVISGMEVERFAVAGFHDSGIPEESIDIFLAREFTSDRLQAGAVIYFRVVNVNNCPVRLQPTLHLGRKE